MKLGTILNKTIHYCNYRERSVKEGERFINKFDITNREKTFIIDYLIKEKIVDNKRYTNEYIVSKFRINKWGKNRIISNLKKENINIIDIENGLKVIDDEEYIDTLKKILIRKKDLMKVEVSKEEINPRLLRYAIYKGFEPDLVNKLIEEEI